MSGGEAGMVLLMLCIVAPLGIGLLLDALTGGISAHHDGKDPEGYDL